MEEQIKIVENGICVDIEQLKKILTNDWQEFYINCHQHGFRGETLYMLILSDIADYADGLEWETERNAQKRLGRPNDRLDWYDLYPKSDVRSIAFEVLNFLASICAEPIEKLITDDIPPILEFLDTPSGKELEAWNKWEKYWANLNYPERRKKLLKNKENCEKIRKILASNKIDVLRGFPKPNDLMRDYLEKELKQDGRTLIQGTFVNIEPLKEFIINNWKLKKIYKSYHKKGKRGEDLYKSILIELSDFADDMEGEILENARKEFGQKICLDWMYQKSDARSIAFEVLNLLYGSWLKIEGLTMDDIPIILEFLDTPPGEELEAWDKWEKYWANLDYTERRKKLLENTEK